MQLPNDKLAFTVEDWAKATGQSRSSIYEAFRNGTLKGKKRGRSTIILREDGENYLASLPDYQSEAA